MTKKEWLLQTLTPEWYYVRITNDLDLGAHKNKTHRNTQREKKMRGKKWKEGQRTLSQVQHSKNEHSFGANI
jgi:hypothetical protein